MFTAVLAEACLFSSGGGGMVDTGYGVRCAVCGALCRKPGFEVALKSRRPLTACIPEAGIAEVVAWFMRRDCTGARALHHKLLIHNVVRHEDAVQMDFSHSSAFVAL